MFLSATRLYDRWVTRLTPDNFTYCQAQDRAGRPWLLSQPVTLIFNDLTSFNQFSSLHCLQRHIATFLVIWERSYSALSIFPGRGTGKEKKTWTENIKRLLPIENTIFFTLKIKGIQVKAGGRPPLYSFAFFHFIIDYWWIASRYMAAISKTHWRFLFNT